METSKCCKIKRGCLNSLYNVILMSPAIAGKRENHSNFQEKRFLTSFEMTIIKFKTTLSDLKT